MAHLRQPAWSLDEARQEVGWPGRSCSVVGMFAGHTGGRQARKLSLAELLVRSLGGMCGQGIQVRRRAMKILININKILT